MKFIGLILFFTSIGSWSAETIRVGITSKPNNLNPLYGLDFNSQNIHRILYQSLIDFNSSMDITCDACVEYSENLLGTKHIIKFVLKEDLYFNDGSKVTSEDIRKSWTIYKDEENKSPLRFAFKKIEDIKILDSKTIEIIYSNFSPDNLINLVLLKIIKEEGKNLTGTTGFKLLEESGREILLGNQKYNLKFNIISDQTTLTLKALNQEVDIIAASVGARRTNYLKEKAKDYMVRSTPGIGYYYLGMNLRDHHLGNKSFRNWLVSNINIKQFVDHKLKGVASPSYGFFQDSIRTNIENDSFDLEGLDNKKFILLYQNSSINRELAHYLETEFKRLGLLLSSISQEWSVLGRNLKSGNFHFFLGSWIGFTDAAIYNTAFHSSEVPPKGRNRTFLEHNKLDELLEDYMTTFDLLKREKKRKEIEFLLNELNPTLHLWHPDVTWIVHKKYPQLKPYPNGSFLPFRDL